MLTSDNAYVALEREPAGSQFATWIWKRDLGNVDKAKIELRL